MLGKLQIILDECENRLLKKPALSRLLEDYPYEVADRGPSARHGLHPPFVQQAQMERTRVTPSVGRMAREYFREHPKVVDITSVPLYRVSGPDKARLNSLRSIDECAKQPREEHRRPIRTPRLKDRLSTVEESGTTRHYRLLRLIIGEMTLSVRKTSIKYHDY
jgi:hypothetical protein